MGRYRGDIGEIGERDNAAHLAGAVVVAQFEGRLARLRVRDRDRGRDRGRDRVS